MSNHTLTWALGGWGGFSFWRAWFPDRMQARWIARMLTRPCTCGAETPGEAILVAHTGSCRKGAYRSFRPGSGSRFVIHVGRSAFEISENDGWGRVRVMPCAPEGTPF